jgi:hypothetical protein
MASSRPFIPGMTTSVTFQIANLHGPETVTEGDQDQCGVALPIAAVRSVCNGYLDGVDKLTCTEKSGREERHGGRGFTGTFKDSSKT